MNPGMSPAVQQALQRRGMGLPTPQLSQTSPGAQMQSQMPQPSNPSDANKASAPTQQGGGSPKFQPASQEDFIVGALVDQLKGAQKLKKEQMQMAAGVHPLQNAPMASPQPQQPAQPQQMGSNPFTPPTSMPTSQMQGGSPLTGVRSPF